MAYEQENIATLTSALNAPLLGCLPYSAGQSPKDVCNELVLDCLEL